jgi:pyruvyltransferase
MTTALAYYWRGQPNFGDQLTPDLLEHFARTDVEWADPQDADVVVTGSVLEHLPVAWGGIIAGSGFLHEESRADFSNAHVVGVRGYLTLERLTGTGIDHLTVADPGLLASELYPADRGKFEVGVLPHWSDTTLYRNELDRAMLADEPIPILIDPAWPVSRVVKLIGSCRHIVTSSLHGVIVADSFGLPRRAERFPNIDKPYEGGDFKFHDYSSALKQPFVFGEYQTAPIERVYDLQYHLFEMFQGLRGDFRV